MSGICSNSCLHLSSHPAKTQKKLKAGGLCLTLFANDSRCQYFFFVSLFLHCVPLDNEVVTD